MLEGRAFHISLLLSGFSLGHSGGPGVLSAREGTGGVGATHRTEVRTPPRTVLSVPTSFQRQRLINNLCKEEKNAGKKEREACVVSRNLSLSFCVVSDRETSLGFFSLLRLPRGDERCAAIGRERMQTDTFFWLKWKYRGNQ